MAVVQVLTCRKLRIVLERRGARPTGGLVATPAFRTKKSKNTLWSWHLQDDKQGQVSLSDLDQYSSSATDPDRTGEVSQETVEERFRELSQRHDTLKTENKQ